MRFFHTLVGLVAIVRARPLALPEPNPEPEPSPLPIFAVIPVLVTLAPVVLQAVSLGFGFIASQEQKKKAEEFAQLEESQALAEQLAHIMGYPAKVRDMAHAVTGIIQTGGNVSQVLSQIQQKMLAIASEHAKDEIQEMFARGDIGSVVSPALGKSKVIAQGATVLLLQLFATVDPEATYPAEDDSGITGDDGAFEDDPNPEFEALIDEVQTLLVTLDEDPSDEEVQAYVDEIINMMYDAGAPDLLDGEPWQDDFRENLNSRIRDAAGDEGLINEIAMDVGSAMQTLTNQSS